MIESRDDDDGVLNALQELNRVAPYELTDKGREIRSLYASIYLAGPMTGMPEYNYPAFHEAAKALRENGIGVVSPAEIHGDDTSREREYYLRRDLQVMLNCGAVVLLPGWSDSDGANLEHQVAVKTGIPCYSIDSVITEVKDTRAERLIRFYNKNFQFIDYMFSEKPINELINEDELVLTHSDRDIGEKLWGLEDYKIVTPDNRVWHVWVQYQAQSGSYTIKGEDFSKKLTSMLLPADKFVEALT